MLDISRAVEVNIAGVSFSESAKSLHVHGSSQVTLGDAELVVSTNSPVVVEQAKLFAVNTARNLLYFNL